MSDSLIDDPEFLSDFARLCEGIYDEKFLRRKYHFVGDKTWELLGQDESLIEKIELERARRVRSGATKRELAQKYMVSAPDVLNNIMNDPEANHRHVVDAIKTMDALADPGPQHAPTSAERFVIRIDLTAGGNKDDVIVIDKPIRKVGADVGKTIEHDDMPLFAAIAANKRTENGGANLFERLSGSQSTPAPLEKKDHHKRRDEEALFAAQRLLDFLQRWPKDTVRLTDIQTYGPNSLRDRKSAIRAAEILVNHGWLARQPTRHYKARLWRIARKLTVRPAVTYELPLNQSFNSEFSAE